MSIQNFDEKPIPLITFKDEEEIIINPEAIAFLKSVPQPIAVVGIAGKYRTGKSFLVNKVILNTKKGFGVGQTIDPCTKGIWIWAKPLKGTSPDGKIVNIIVLDSEGLAAIDVDSNHDSRIFSMVMLLSSVFIYNSIGAIDENALENLSLIVNLTKNIQIKSEGNDDVDFEDFAFYMPSFIWILRDFSLELKDQNGNELTSDEYLEKALKDQEGFSDQIERKNTIRRMIRGFFQEKDCYTMVRPVIDEENLRNLQDFDISQFRPEFIDQALNLKKRLFSHVRIKSVQNQQLSGEMLAELTINYVKALNCKEIPNIQNAWTYISNQKCQDAYEFCYDLYEKEIKDALSQQWPLSESNLEIIHNECVDQVNQKFDKIAFGDKKQIIKNKLNEKLKEQFLYLKEKNLRDFEIIFSKSMEDFYVQNVQKKLELNEYKQYVDFEKDLRLFEQYFIDMLPQGPHKQQLLLQFMVRMINECSQVIMQQKVDVMNQQISDVNIIKIKKEKELIIKNDENEQLNQKIQEMEKQSKRLLKEQQDKLDLVQQSMQQLKIEKENQEIQREEEMKQEIDNYDLQQKQINEELLNQQKNNKEYLKQIKIMKSKFEQESALMNQKNGFNEEKIVQIQNDKNQEIQQINNEKDQIQQQFNESQQQNEQMEKEFGDEIKNLQKKISQQENQIEQEQKQQKGNEIQFQQQINKQKEQLQQLQQQLVDNSGNKENEKLLKLLNNNLQQKDEEIDNYNKKQQEMNQQIQQLSDKYKKYKIQQEKERAIKDQKLNFMDQKCQSISQQLKDAKKMQEEAIKAIEYSQSEEKMDLNSQLKMLTDSHQKEVKNYENQLKQMREQMQIEINTLTENKDLIENEMLEENNKNKEQIKELRQRFETADKERLQLKKDIQQYQSNQDNLEQKEQQKYKKVIKNLKIELEEQKQINSKEFEQNQEKQENYLKQMKSVFEQEKERLEKKLSGEQGKYKQKLEIQNKEYEDKLNQNQIEFEEESENLRNEVEQMRIGFQAGRNQIEEEMKMKDQQLIHLESQYNQSTNDFEELKNNYEVNVNKIKKVLQIEKREMLQQIEQMKEERSEKEKEFWILQQKLDKLNSDLPKNILNQQKIIEQYKKDKELFIQQKEQQRKQYEQMMEDNIDIKINQEKKLALAEQKNDFLTKRVSEIQNQLIENQKKMENKLLENKKFYETQIFNLKDKYNQQIQQLEEKNDYKNKMAQEGEGALQEKLNDLKQNYQQLNNKHNNYKSQIEKQQQQETEELENTKNQLLSNQQKLVNLQKSKNKEIEQLKDEKCQMEIDYSELEAGYERDKALWDGKINFQQELIERLKTDLQEQKSNFDLMYQQMKKIRKYDSEETANSQTVKFESLKQSHKAYLNELKEKMKLKEFQFQKKINSLEKEIKILNSKIIEEKNKKIDSNSEMDKRIHVFIDNEKSMRDQMSKMKIISEQEVVKVQQNMDDMERGFKAKMKVLQDDIKNYQTMKTKMIIENEQMMRKYTIDKDQLFTEKSELTAEMSQIRRKKDQLLRENEKLKNENRKNKKVIGNTFTSNLNSKFNCFNNSKLQERSFIAFESKIPSLNFQREEKSSFMKNESTNEENDNFLEKISLEKDKNNQFIILINGRINNFQKFQKSEYEKIRI